MAKLSASTLTSGIGTGAAQVFTHKGIDFSNYHNRRLKALQSYAKAKGTEDPFSIPTQVWNRDRGVFLKMIDIYKNNIIPSGDQSAIDNAENIINLFADGSSTQGAVYDNIFKSGQKEATDESWTNFLDYGNVSSLDDNLITFVDNQFHYDGVPILTNPLFSELPSLASSVDYDFIKDLLEKTKEVFNVEEIDDITKTEASEQKMKDQVSFFVDFNPKDKEQKKYFIEQYLQDFSKMSDINPNFLKYYMGDDDIDEDVLQTIQKNIEEGKLLPNYSAIKDKLTIDFQDFMLNRMGVKKLLDEPKTSSNLYFTPGGGTVTKSSASIISDDNIKPILGKMKFKESWYRLPEGDELYDENILGFPNRDKERDINYEVKAGYDFVSVSGVNIPQIPVKVLAHEAAITGSYFTKDEDFVLKDRGTSFENSDILSTYILPTLTKDYTITVREKSRVIPRDKKIDFKKGDVIPVEFYDLIPDEDKQGLFTDEKWVVFVNNNINYLTPYSSIENILKESLKGSKYNFDLEKWEEDNFNFNVESPKTDIFGNPL